MRFPASSVLKLPGDRRLSSRRRRQRHPRQPSGITDVAEIDGTAFLIDSTLWPPPLIAELRGFSTIGETSRHAPGGRCRRPPPCDGQEDPFLQRADRPCRYWYRHCGRTGPTLRSRPRAHASGRGGRRHRIRNPCARHRGRSSELAAARRVDVSRHAAGWQGCGHQPPQFVVLCLMMSPWRSVTWMTSPRASYCRSSVVPSGTQSLTRSPIASIESRGPAESVR